MKTGKANTPLRTALIYAFFGALWILLTDELLNFFIPATSPNHILLQTIKGWLFVLASASLIYLFLRGDMAALLRNQREITYHARLIDDVTDAIISTDMQFHILTWNTAAEVLYGWKASEVIGHVMREFIENDYGGTSREEIIETAMEKGTWQGEVSQNRRDGTRFFVFTSLSLVKDEKEQPIGFVAINHDLSEHKQAEVALRKSEAKWETLVKTIPDYIALFDREGKYAFLSHYAEGFSEKDVIGKHYANFIREDAMSTYATSFEKARESGTTQFTEFRGYGDRGSIREYESTFTPIFEKGEFVNMLVLARDITERKQMQEEMRNSEIKYRTLVENSLQGVTIYQNQKPVYVNPAMCKINGYSAEEFLALSAEQVIAMTHPDDLVIARERALKRMAGEPVSPDFETRLIRKDGTIAWLHSFNTSIVLDGEPAILSTAIDITERKQAEARTLHVNRLYATISQINQAIVRAKDPTTLFSEICRIAIEYGKFHMAWVGLIDKADGYVRPVTFAGEEHGYLDGIEIALHDPMLSRGPTGSAIREGRCIICQDINADPRMESWREAALQRGYRSSASVPIFRKSGPAGALTVYSNEVQGFSDDDQHLLDEIGLDISHALDSLDAEAKRLQAEENLLQSEKRFRSLIEHGLDNISLLDENGILLWESPSTIRTLGYGQDAYKGRNILDLVHPEDLEWVRVEFQEILHQPNVEHHATFRIHHLDGSWRWIESIGTNLLEEPSVGAIVINYRDVTEKKKAEEALRVNEEKYRDLVENSQNLICTHDLEGNLLSVNKAAVLLSGYSRESLLKMNLKDVIADKGGRQFAAYLKKIKTDGQAQGTMKVRMANGEFRYWAFNNSLRTEGVTEPIVRGSARDVTERKLAEDALRESEERFHKAFRSSPVGMAITTSGGRYIDANDSFSEITGFRREELLSQTSLQLKITTPEQHQEYTRLISKQGSIYNHEMTLRHKTGDVVVVLGSMEIIELNHQACVLSTAIDITERQQAEKRFSSAFNSSPTAITITRVKDGRVVDVNEAWSDLFGYTRDQAIGRSAVELGITNEEVRKQVIDKLRAEQLIRGLEATIYTSTGEKRDVLLSMEMIDINGEPHSLTSLIDITQRKQAESLLKQSEERYRLLFENMPIAIWEEDFSQVREYLDALKAQGVKDFRAYFAEHPEAVVKCIDMMEILDVNQSALTMYKAKSKDELIKDTNEDTGQVEVERINEILIALAYGSISGNWEGPEETMTGDLIEVNLSWAIVPGHEQDLSRIIVTTIDVSERKRAAKRDQKKTQALELLARGASLPIVLESIVAIVENELAGSICSILLLDEARKHLIHGAAPHLPDFYNEAIHGLPIGMGEGSCGTAAFTGQRVIVQDIETHPFWEKYRDIAHQAGVRSCWSQPILASSGEVLGTFAVYHTKPSMPERSELDTILSVTSLASIAIEQKHAEQTIREYAVSLEKRVEQRTAELLRANRIKDEFLANMSHELRTPLNSVLGYSETLLEGVRGELDERQGQAVEMIHTSGQHLLSLINDILDVSKMDAGKFEIRPEVVPVNDICESSLAFVKQLANKKSITVEYAPTSALLTMSVDPKRLKQILVNLLNNAVKFTPEKGKVSLEVRADAERGEMRFSVSDTGIGIEANDLPKLFKPFVQLDGSLSRQYEGSGLGLMLVKQLVEMHDGRVYVESEVGRGSIFTVVLPWQEIEEAVDDGLFILEDVNGKNVTPTSQNSNSSNGKKILLAEDNEANVMMVKDYLENHGYRILVAHHGGEVLEGVSEFSPDLILMDIQMPKMDGLEATRRLRARPEFASVPIIALTAFAMPGDRERCLEAGANEYMSKPVILRKLLELISDLLK